MECDGERIIIDSNIGDFDFSPIVMFDSGRAQIALLWLCDLHNVKSPLHLLASYTTLNLTKNNKKTRKIV